MLKLWGKEFADGRMIADMVVTAKGEQSRTQKVYECMDKICAGFDLQKPIWLDNTIHEFQVMNRARFYQDSFIEEIDFDFLEIQVLEDN